VHNETICLKDGFAEDWEMGRCLEKSAIFVGKLSFDHFDVELFSTPVLLKFAKISWFFLSSNKL
jgi:hypothetical protein